MIDNLDVNLISEKSPIGYVLEVDLEYPDELHVFYDNYPLAPEKLAIPYDMFSNYCQKIADEYGRGITKESIALRPKMYSHLSYLTWDDFVDKKTEGIRMCTIECKINIEHYKVFGKDETILKLRQRFRSEVRNLFTKKVDEIALSASDDNRLKTDDGVTSYPWGTGV